MNTQDTNSIKPTSRWMNKVIDNNPFIVLSSSTEMNKRLGLPSYCLTVDEAHKEIKVLKRKHLYSGLLKIAERTGKKELSSTAINTVFGIQGSSKLTFITIENNVSAHSLEHFKKSNLQGIRSEIYREIHSY